MGFPSGSDSTESNCNDLDRKPTFDPWVGKIPWRREWLPSPVSLPGESHGQRSLAGSSWGHKELDMSTSTQVFTLSPCYLFIYLFFFFTKHLSLCLCTSVIEICYPYLFYFSFLQFSHLELKSLCQIKQ